VSLRDIDPDLPLPRLINGLPPIIGPRDRAMIRNNHKSIIIFWSSIFSIYRVLKSSYALKLSTITDSFSGSLDYLSTCYGDIEKYNYFSCLPNYDK